MPTGYPGSIDTVNDLSPVPNLSEGAPPGTRDYFLTQLRDAVIALQTQVGVGSAVPTAGGAGRLLAHGTLDHGDTSPVTLLAANAEGAGDRRLLVRLTATEAAAGEPDVDVGQTGTITKWFEDIAAGAWALGDSFVAIATLTEEVAMIATIAAAGSAGAFLYEIWEVPDFS